MYSLDWDYCCKKAEGAKKYIIVGNIKHSDYYDLSSGTKKIKNEMSSINSKSQCFDFYVSNKVWLSCYGNKRNTLGDGIISLMYGHELIS